MPSVREHSFTPTEVSAAIRVSKIIADIRSDWFIFGFQYDET